MQTDILDIILGFFEGLALIISPCILPILPIVLASSITGSKARPAGITVGFVLTFALVAFFSRLWIHALGVDLNLIRHIAYAMLLLLGFTMLSSFLTARFNQLAQWLLSLGGTIPHNLHDGFFSGLWVGSMIALVWTPCVGPILAAVIVQTVIQQSTVLSFLTLLSFALGAAIPMLLIAIYGKQLINRFDFLKTRSVLLRQLLGVLIMASVAWMIIEEHTTLAPATIQTTIKTATRLQKGLWLPYPAPSIDGIERWINSAPLTISALKDRVVLIDFWTYSCINCIRTLPYLKHYFDQYHDRGLTIIGIHAPEFDFEQVPANVKAAVVRYGIPYPVALDNQFVTWRHYKNHYWPAQFLINKQGQVVYEHFGEGDEEVTENNIRFLLGIDGIALPTPIANSQITLSQTPETYLGYKRADRTQSPSSLQPDKSATYHFASSLALNAWGLNGEWRVLPDKIIAQQSQASIKIHFNARFVYVVMSNGQKPALNVQVRFGNRTHPILVNQQSIYRIIALPHVSKGVVELIADKPGLEIYTFTFGG